jgi:hypothetical protein
MKKRQKGQIAPSTQALIDKYGSGAPKEKPIARQSKYRKEYDQRLIDHMSEGYSFESFAGVANVCPDTLYEWARVHKSFIEAKKIAFAKCRAEWERIGLNGIKGMYDGFGGGAWIYNMKCRFQKEWLAADKASAPQINSTGKLVIDMSGTEQDDDTDENN